MVDRSVSRHNEPSTGVADAESLLADVPPDANVLVSGPPMTGKYRLMLRLLAVHADGIVVISTKNGAAKVTEDVRSAAPNLPDDHLGIVDCVSHHKAAGDVTDTELVKYADSPENLTRIGVKFTELYDTFENRGLDDVAVGIHSLSQLLMHADVKKVFQFLQVLNGHIRNAGWLGAAVIDDSVVDDQELETLKHQFDGVVRTRENDAGRREFQVQGLPSDSPWTPF